MAVARRVLAGLVALIVTLVGVAVLSPPAPAAADDNLGTTAATTWRYLDTGVDPAAGLADRTDWSDPGFDDSAWKSAKGSFGAKNGAIGDLGGGYTPATLLTHYSSGTTSIPAYFFRTQVTVPAGGLAGVDALTASLVYDDAATVYVNGTRVAGFDDTAITTNTMYGGSNASTPKAVEFTIPAAAFTEGVNTVGVELHNGRASSSDVYLDVSSLALPAPTAPTAPTGPVISTADTTWRFLDTGTDPAAGLTPRTAWTAPAYDDSTWKSAVGSFGAKNGAISDLGNDSTPRTLVNQYKNGTAFPDIEALFFRTKVDVPAAVLAEAGSFVGTIKYDDTATVYVNGIRVAGFLDGSVTANLQYAGNSGGSPVSSPLTIPASAFTAGENTVSVEIHQDRTTSSDIYFDLVSLEASADEVPEVPTDSGITDLILGIGANEAQRNVNWYSATTEAQVVELVAADQLVGGQFPATGAATFTSTQGLAAELGKTWHKATLAGLEATTEYAYRVGTGTTWSPTHRFTTGDYDNEFDFIYVGDPQIGSSGNIASDTSGWSDTLAKAKIQVPTAEWLLSAGDQVDSAGNEDQYDGFLSPHQVKEWATSPTVGNHEVGSRTAYYQHYNVPNYDATSGDYWYTYGDTLFMNLDSNFNTEPQRAAHVAWMEDAIELNPDAKWQVVVQHHAMYSSGPHATDSDNVTRRATMAAQFQRLGVDLALAGHDHIYTRSHPMAGNTPVPETDGTPDTIQAGEGSVLYMTASSSSGSKFYGASNAGQPWVGVSAQPNVPQFTQVSVSDASIRLTTYRADTLAVVDEVTLEAPEAPQLSAVTGTVAGAGGTPLSGACAYLYESRGSPAASYASCTDDSGGFVIPEVAPGSYVLAVADPSGAHETWWSPDPVDVDGAQAPVAVTLPRASVSASGVVSDGAGAVADACVYLYSSPQASSAAYATCADASGSWWLGGIVPGDYTVAVADPSGAHDTWWSAGPVGIDGAQAPLSTVLVAADGAIAGAVSGSAGAPVGGACVYVYAPGATAGASYASCAQADGSYYVGDVATGDWEVAFFDPSATYATQWWTGAAGGASDRTGAGEVGVGHALVPNVDAALTPVG
ncbi:metallophosphoesterase family protein [Nocardioides sp. W7]|uniref:purple acid phosphatase family protein n=1 Tax=Nocardioides sp. W7 TaxID=2931390 RepID=UPI001FD4D871|nr:metallophosphoesterase family protein [Nocardioides sp. W7]